ncbi:MAG: hypothetical protein WD801_03685 [Gemmatimonadaceae bacterium]
MRRELALPLTIAIALATCADTASAGIPAFARKYGLSCASCHSPIPRLTPLGETFAANGFEFSPDENTANADRQYDQDGYKTFALRFSQDVGPLRLGALGYSGGESVGGGGSAATNRVRVFGPALGELVFQPQGPLGRWAFTGLANYVDANAPVVSLRLGEQNTPVGFLQRYVTAGAGAHPAADARVQAVAADTISAALVAEGKKVFEGKSGGALCFSCHGLNAKGYPGIGPDVTDAKWLHADGTLASMSARTIGDRR